MAHSRIPSSNAPKSEAAPVASRRRYSPEVRRKAVELVLSGKSKVRVAREIGCSAETVRLWVKKAKEKLSVEAGTGAPSEERSESGKVSQGETREAGEPAPRGTKAKRGLSPYEVEAILKIKKRHPGMGPAQIRAQLKRFKGWRLGIRAIARALVQNGYELEHRGGRPQELMAPRRWEAPRRNALWQADFTEVGLPEGRRALGIILDDFSRFVVGFGLFENPTSRDVVAMFTEAIRLHGKPEAVYTDRGSPFMAWGKAESFQRFLQSELIDHFTTPSYRPQGRGKIEAVVRTVKRELWEIECFASQEEALRSLKLFFEHYNYRRAHLGLDGLTPADRFFGRWETVLACVAAESRKRQGALIVGENTPLIEEIPPAGASEILRIMAVEGELEFRFLGHRVRLGRIEG